jgi:redox-sensitive bicupin YhaK (pirin superfamily)
LVASRNAADGSLLIHQDVCIYLLDLDKEKSIEYPLNANRHVWIQVLRGSVTVNEQSLTAGDGAAVSGESVLHFTATMNTEIMLMDLA